MTIEEFIAKHKPCNLIVTYNDHHIEYTTPKEYMREKIEDRNLNEDDYDLADLDVMQDTDTIWEVHCYPNTPIGFHVFYASTLSVALDRVGQPIESK